MKAIFDYLKANKARLLMALTAGVLAATDAYGVQVPQWFILVLVAGGLLPGKKTATTKG
jgi:hypothetical protein